MEDSPSKSIFADHALEMCHVDYVEPGNPPKPPFVLRTIEEQMEILRGSASRPLLIRVSSERQVLINRTITNVFGQSSSHSTSGSTCCGTPACTGRQSIDWAKHPKREQRQLERKEGASWL